ncbi:MAG: tRNA (cytidine(34)-2'-O)-methyltransferase [Leptospiraceae bacterium]|nr:tRNA (cytidine(34)-2'-O)-methyltransferase [Leptospiraceae bacterium]
MIALYRPQIPPNTGNISRLCVGSNMPLAIVGKAAFSMDQKQVKRAGLDHWEDLQLKLFKRYADFYRAHSNTSRIICITKGASSNLFDFSFQPEDILLFGNETQGLPPKLLKHLPYSVRIPMSTKVRSLNLSNSVAIVLYEYLRQMDLQGKSFELREHIAERTYYKKNEK